MHPNRTLAVISALGRIITTVTVTVAAVTVLGLAWFTVQHQQVLIVTSGSMSPRFNAGDVVISAPTRAVLHAGDIVTFGGTATHAPTTHRVHAVKVQPDGLYLQTKGDANTTPDPNLVPVSDVSGVLVGTIPRLGFWLAFYGSTVGKLLVLGTPLVLILIAQVASLWGGRRRDDAATTLAVSVSS